MESEERFVESDTPIRRSLRKSVTTSYSRDFEVGNPQDADSDPYATDSDEDYKPQKPKKIKLNPDEKNGRLSPGTKKLDKKTKTKNKKSGKLVSINISKNDCQKIDTPNFDNSIESNISPTSVTVSSNNNPSNSSFGFISTFFSLSTPTNVSNSTTTNNISDNDKKNFTPIKIQKIKPVQIDLPKTPPKTKNNTPSIPKPTSSQLKYIKEEIEVPLVDVKNLSYTMSEKASEFIAKLNTGPIKNTTSMHLYINKAFDFLKLTKESISSIENRFRQSLAHYIKDNDMVLDFQDNPSYNKIFDSEDCSDCEIIDDEPQSDNLNNIIKKIESNGITFKSFGTTSKVNQNCLKNDQLNRFNL